MTVPSADISLMIWEEILKQVESSQRIDEGAITCWLRPIKVIDCKNGELILEVKNSFSSKMVQKYIPTLIEIARKKKLPIREILLKQQKQSVEEHSITADQAGGSEPFRGAYQRVQPEQINAGRIKLGGQEGKSAQVSTVSTVSKGSGPLGVNTSWGVKERLNPNYTQQEFVVANHNQVAFNAMQTIVQNKGQCLFNPLLIYGNCGVGKTHLLQLLAHQLIKKGSIPFTYTSAEQFTNEFIDYSRKKKLNEFRAKYRQLRLIMVDDIQFFSGKHKTTEEFFHTFNDIYQNGGQIVVTSDRQPDQIGDIKEQLISRFQGGLIEEIKPPSLKSKKQIIDLKLKKYQLSLEEKSTTLIACHVGTNIREVEGVLRTLSVLSEINPAPLSEEVLLQTLGVDEKSTQIKSSVSVDKILDVVGNYFQLKREDIISKKRSKGVVFARYISLLLVEKLVPSITLEQMSNNFNYEKVVYLKKAQAKAKEQLASSAKIKQDFYCIEAYLKDA